MFDGMKNKAMGGMKDQISAFLGSEEYEIIADLLNNQLEQQAEILKLAGKDVGYEEIPAEKIQRAMEEHGIEKASEAILTSFNKEQTRIQRTILEDLGVEKSEIKEFPQT